MNILFITPFYLFPPYWGGGRRTYNFVKYLSEKHNVFLIMPNYLQFEEKRDEKYRLKLIDMGVKVYSPNPPIKIKHSLVKHINFEVILKCLEIIWSNKIDLIICDYPWAGIDALIVHLITGIPMVFHEHNIEFKIKDEIRAKYGNLMKILEMILCKVSKKIIVVSEKDRDMLVSLGINKNKIEIIENGFDSDVFYPNNKKIKGIRKKHNIGDDPIVLFFGKLDYPPNKDAVYIIRWNILPKVLREIPNAKFLIVGKKYPFNIHHKSLIFTGLVDNIEDYVNAADVVIVPLVSGGGTRIKILESIACGKIIVATTKGAEGLVNKLTKKFLKITDDWDEFSQFVVEAIKRRERIKVPHAFIKKYAWKHVLTKLDKILKETK